MKKVHFKELPTANTALSTLLHFFQWMKTKYFRKFVYINEQYDFCNFFVNPSSTRMKVEKGYSTKDQMLFPSSSANPQKSSVLDMIKLSDGEVPVMLKLWGIRSTPLLPLLPGQLWPGVVAPDRALSMG